MRTPKKKIKKPTEYSSEEEKYHKAGGTSKILNIKIEETKESKTTISSNNNRKHRQVTLNDKPLKRVPKKQNVSTKQKLKKNNDQKSVILDDNESESDLPTGRLLNLKKETRSDTPQISLQHWKKFKNEVEKKGDSSEITQKVKKCLGKMHSYQTYDLHITSLYFIRKAIVDSLLKRKWDNLLKLLVLMIRNYSDPVFTGFIRNMCQILKHYHPRIQGTDLEDQIQLIIEKHENIRNSRRNLTNTA